MVSTKRCDRLKRLRSSLYCCQASSLARGRGFFTVETSSKRIGIARAENDPVRCNGNNSDACRKRKPNMRLVWKGGDIGSRCQAACGIERPVLRNRVSSTATPTSFPGQKASPSFSNGINRAWGSQTERECRKYSPDQDFCSRPLVQRMRDTVARPNTSNAPSAWRAARTQVRFCANTACQGRMRSEEHTSELQSHSDL